MTVILFSRYEPEEELFRCSTCGRYFDTMEMWRGHEMLHKKIGNYNPTNFVCKINRNGFVKK